MGGGGGRGGRGKTGLQEVTDASLQREMHFFFGELDLSLYV